MKHIESLTMKIRSVHEDDFPQIVDLFKELASFQKTPDKMKNSVERMLEEKEFFHAFVAENEEKQIIGYVTYFFSYHTWSGKAMYMDDLYVKEAYRKNGIGQDLLNAVIDFAKESQCHKLRWQVSHWNTNAQEFYKKIGAEIDDVEWNCDLILK